MRTVDVQVVPSVEVVITISLVAQPLLKPQSCQTRYTLPAPSISAEGSGPLRRLPATVCLKIESTVTVLLQLVPPLVDLKARMEVSLALASGTMTVPLGCTTGWPPMPVALLAVLSAAPQL